MKLFLGQASIWLFQNVVFWYFLLALLAPMKGLFPEPSHLCLQLFDPLILLDNKLIFMSFFLKHDQLFLDLKHMSLENYNESLNLPYKQP